MKKLLTWDKPNKARTTEDHNREYQSDSGVDGTYVPNMSDEDKFRWKAKRIGGKDLRIEIRKTTQGRSRGSEAYGSYAQTLLVVRPDGTVTMSMNGKAEFDVFELRQAIDEAYAAFLHPEQEENDDGQL